MPELPDVEIQRRYLEANGLHRRIQEVEVRHQRLVRNLAVPRFCEELRGRTLESTLRHGKYLLVKLNGAGWLVFHFGMDGSLALQSPGEPDPPYARIILRFADGDRLSYLSRRLLGGLELVADPDELISSHGLGPDILGARFDAAVFRKVLAGRRGLAKAALMDQQALAGIGNIYSDEILFQAGIDPQRPAASLTEEEIARLYRSLKEVLQTAIAHQADPDRFPSSYLISVRRKGGLCPKCGTGVEQRKIGGRTSYRCPQCQR